MWHPVPLLAADWLQIAIFLFIILSSLASQFFKPNPNPNPQQQQPPERRRARPRPAPPQARLPPGPRLSLQSSPASDPP